MRTISIKREHSMVSFQSSVKAKQRKMKNEMIMAPVWYTHTRSRTRARENEMCARTRANVTHACMRVSIVYWMGRADGWKGTIKTQENKSRK